MKAIVHVTLKNGVLDPQGRAVQHALNGLGFEGIHDVRQGKLIEINLSDTNQKLARVRVTEMCNKLLANAVIENYKIEIVDS